MAFRDIPQAEWRAFLDRLSREHRAWLATVDRDGRVEARDEPLREIRLDGGIHLELGSRVVHVDAPHALRLQETQEGAPEALEIYQGTGSTVTMRLRISEPPGELDGLAPGERA